MKCKKCGNEIKEGNSFCVNCGTSLEKKLSEEKSKEGNKLKSKLKIIIPIAVIILVIAIGTIVVINKNNKSNDTNISNDQEQKQKIGQIEIGVDYNIVSEDADTKSAGFIRFNTNTDYIMELGDYASESFTKTGNYTISKNIITLTVNYDSAEEETTTTPYTEKIEILENGNLKYTNKNNITYMFAKGNNVEETNNLLEEIYAKYPELENSDIPICTDDNGTYWLLDENGKKVYFSDLETFESALEKCKITTENTGSINNETNIDSNAEYIDIPNLIGKTEKEAINILKGLNAPYKIVYHEDIKQEEGIVLDQSTHDEIITNSRGEIVTAISTRKLYKGETLTIYINQYKERTLKIDFHKSCLIENFLPSVNDKLSAPLNVIVKANDTVIFNDKLTNEDLRSSTVDNCKTSIISYTGKTPPVITVLVNGTVFRTYDKEYTSGWFYEESNEPHYMGFTEHGAG